jgi:hypothetical protein
LKCEIIKIRDIALEKSVPRVSSNKAYIYIGGTLNLWAYNEKPVHAFSREKGAMEGLYWY